MTEFFVPGVPIAKGSKVAGRTKSGILFTRETNAAKQKPWAAAVRVAAIKAMKGAPPLDGPVWLDIDFVMPRPKKHFRSNGELRSDAPRFHTIKPDRDKLLRCVGDALSGVVYKDDCQACTGPITKLYGDAPGGVRIAFDSLPPS